MNVLSARIEGARFADLYAGSGAVGIEALSRGAAFCLFSESASNAIAAIRDNLEKLGVDSGFALDTRAVVSGLTDTFGQGAPFDLVFLDPPYEAALEYEVTLHHLGKAGQKVLASGGVAVAEHARRSPLKEQYGSLARYRLLEQGDAALSFFRAATNHGIR